MCIFYQYIHFNQNALIGQFSTYLLNIADTSGSVDMKPFKLGPVARFSRTFEPCPSCDGTVI